MASHLTSNVTDLAGGVENIGHNSANKEKPLLVFCAAPVAGHTHPILRIAAELVKRGYDLCFITGPQFRDQLGRLGVEHIEIPDMPSEAQEKARQEIPAGPPRFIWDLKHLFLDQIPLQYSAMKGVLEKLHKRDPSRRIIIMHETLYLGVLPFIFGAPLPEGFTSFPKVINLNIVPIVVTSIDTAPFGPGLPPDSTPSGRARNKLLYEQMSGGPFVDLTAHSNEIFKSIGVTSEPVGFLFDTWLTSYDVTLQMCPPSLEYPRSDLHPSFKFAGCLPPRPPGPDYPYPEWWNEVAANTTGKKIVAVAQGTVAVDFMDLVIPTIQGLAGREDTLVVAILGSKGATLPDDVVANLPANARVIDYLPYDALLPHTDVFVMNGGYGGVMHGIVNGVPLVLAGDTEDKPETVMRAEWAGVAVNLRTGRPTAEQVAAGVDEVLGNNKYKERALQIMKENEDLDAMGVVERQIRAMAEQSSGES
ncbi:hypothetical protein QBC33DRAFT_551129 [Phialemonium atrogriseum]|uniref:Erythromycin biosynthesis protein CIII-like C-terminal domain-containing protein n=1 Tax=Phialemonium atrogriseum TaxID=1093897 RepID=A0AAJ0FBS2_9PEZI|nr:uncharacterized protein QBC33DRAFT_551129 [Phialemonium atrogriseum]KAK1762806.1 hypothetical protein QBC33DRAFT_551129 [Phialemonium atrogriseum]